MNLAPHWETAAVAVAVLAVAAKAVRAVTWSGAVAGTVVGVAVAAGFGPAGLAVLGTFFVVGTVATKVGYAKKAARGAAEKRGGARGWENVVGKGGVAAAIALAAAGGHAAPIAFVGAVAAALADTLGTEIGSMSRGGARTLPAFRSVPHGTPGAVSLNGTLGTIGGALVIVLAAALVTIPFPARSCGASPAPSALAGGVLGAFAESCAMGVAPRLARVPGWIRNVLTTAAGAAIAGALWSIPL